jgi:hypothetical protein
MIRGYQAVLSVIALAAPVCGQQAIHLSVNQPRPLEALVDRLERAAGVPINYEDPRYACPGDVLDITNEVQNPSQRAANPAVRILVPRGGGLTLDGVLPGNPRPGDELPLVNAAMAQYAASGLPGRFAVRQIGNVSTVEPAEARGPDCRWAKVSPAMETGISFPARTRAAADTLTLILEAVSKGIGVKVGLGSVPMLAFVNRQVTLGAADEAAASVLVRLFEQLSSPGRVSYSYHLFYDPGLRYYMADIATVSPPRSPASPTSVPPPSGGVFGAKKANQ